MRVNGAEIPPQTIVSEIQNHPAPHAATAREQAIRALIVRELLLQEARRRGMVPSPRLDAAGRRETEGDALIRQLIEAEIETPQPGETECREFYEANLGRFRGPDRSPRIWVSAPEDAGSIQPPSPM